MMSIKAELADTMRHTSFKISNVRGIGKIFAFDVDHQLLRDELVLLARDAGFKVNPLSQKTIGFTPSLLFAEFHFTKFANFLKKIRPSTQYLGH